MSHVKFEAFDQVYYYSTLCVSMCEYVTVRACVCARVRARLCPREIHDIFPSTEYLDGCCHELGF